MFTNIHLSEYKNEAFIKMNVPFKEIDHCNQRNAQFLIAKLRFRYRNTMQTSAIKYEKRSILQNEL